MKRGWFAGLLILLGSLLVPVLLPPQALAASPVASQARPAGETLTLDAYWQRVQETRDLVAKLAGVPPETWRAQLDAAAAQWEQVTAVALPDGTRVPVDHTFLAAQLRRDPPDLEYLDALLENLLAARDSWARESWSAADLEALEQILARPEYQWKPQEPSLLAQWWERVKEWLWDLLDWLIPQGWAGSPALRFVLTALGIAALGAALFFALRGTFAGLATEKELAAEAAGEENLTAAAALKRAEALSGEGDYRAAVRYLYLSALLLLEEHGLLRYDRSLTNREYLRSVAGRPELEAALRRVVEVFEHVWYGYEPLAEPAYLEYKEWVTELQKHGF
jgi:hypothetical protein